MKQSGISLLLVSILLKDFCNRTFDKKFLPFALCKTECGCAGSPASAWRLLIGNFVVHHIRKRIVTEAHRQMQNEIFDLTVEELESFIAVMYVRGVKGKSGLP